MRKLLVFILVSLSYSCSNKEPLPSIIDTPEEEQCPSCIWNDEFNGSSINIDNWNFETGYGSNGWGNDEWQLYTNNNAKISDGNLIISVKKESSTIGKRNGSITSSRLTTQGKVTVGPGMRIEAKIKGPWGQGIWPAFWTIGANFPAVGWPACGEIDILEYAGGNPLSNEKNKINFSTHHWSHNGSHASYGNSITHTQPLSNDYNIYELIWTNDYIETRLNGKSFHVIDIKSGIVHEPFHNKHFLILNLNLTYQVSLLKYLVIFLDLDLFHDLYTYYKTMVCLDLFFFLYHVYLRLRPLLVINKDLQNHPLI